MIKNPYDLSRIFYVDDDADDREILEEVLQTLYPAVLVKGFADGMELLNGIWSSLEELPSIIFIDLNMPSFNGFDCLAELKKSPSLQAIPVIILTTSSSINDTELSLELGANKFITKPNSFQKLCDVIERTVKEIADPFF